MTQFGTSAGPDDRIYYSLRSGKKVYLSTSDEKDDLPKIEVPNTRISRYIAYGYPRPANQRGLLQFGDKESVHQKITIHEPVIGRPPIVALRIAGKEDSQFAELWQHDGDTSSRAVSGVSVVLRFEDEGEIVIPVENDRLVIGKARLPKGFTLGE